MFIVESKPLESHGQSRVTESALIRSRLRALYRKIFAKMDYCKTLCPEPASAGLYGKIQN